jgi:hypothetical protein
VVALFDDATVVEHDHEVCGGDGGEAVGDEQGDPALSPGVMGGCCVPVEEVVFGGGVERGGGFVAWRRA